MGLELVERELDEDTCELLDAFDAVWTIYEPAEQVYGEAVRALHRVRTVTSDRTEMLYPD